MAGCLLSELDLNYINIFLYSLWWIMSPNSAACDYLIVSSSIISLLTCSIISSLEQWNINQLVLLISFVLFFPPPECPGLTIVCGRCRCFLQHSVLLRIVFSMTSKLKILNLNSRRCRGYVGPGDAGKTVGVSLSLVEAGARNNVSRGVHLKISFCPDTCVILGVFG